MHYVFLRLWNHYERNLKWFSQKTANRPAFRLVWEMTIALFALMGLPVILIHFFPTVGLIATMLIVAYATPYIFAYALYWSHERD